MSIFKDLVIDASKKSRMTYNKGIPFMYSNKLTRYLNPIRKGQYYAVAGRSSAGKRSFVDTQFVLNSYIWWLSQDPSSRPPLKILYYNMDKSAKMKLQKMLCTYFWLQYQWLIDTNTLNGSSSSMYGWEKWMEDYMEKAKSWFDYFFNNILVMYNGQKSPSTIHNNTLMYLKGIGDEEFDHNNRRFVYNKENDNQITLLVVDNIRKLKNESGKTLQQAEYELNKNMNEAFVDLRDSYQVTPVVIIPSFDVPGVVRLNQMVPDFREFKYYYEDSNIALHLFNPDRFRIEDFMGLKTDEYISHGDNVSRLRICSILRNTEGVDNTFIPMGFLPENGFFYDLPEDITDIENMKYFLQNIKITYKNGIIT
jgi:hypothetical protein